VEIWEGTVVVSNRTEKEKHEMGHHGRKTETLWWLSS